MQMHAVVVVAAPVPVLLVVCHHVEEAAAWGVGVAGDRVAAVSNYFCVAAVSYYFSGAANVRTTELRRAQWSHHSSGSPLPLPLSLIVTVVQGSYPWHLQSSASSNVH